MTGSNTAASVTSICIGPICSPSGPGSNSTWVAGTRVDEPVSQVLGDPSASPLSRILALTARGLLRARRGDPHVWAPLDEALALADLTGELQRLGPVAAARAEAVWLEGNTKPLPGRRMPAWPLRSAGMPPGRSASSRAGGCARAPARPST